MHKCYVIKVIRVEISQLQSESILFFSLVLILVKFTCIRFLKVPDKLKSRASCEYISKNKYVADRCYL